jgi:hypothetical protein
LALPKLIRDGGFRDSSPADEGLLVTGGQKVNGAGRLGGGTNVNSDGCFSDDVMDEEGFGVVGGIQGTTHTFNGDPEEDACCGTTKVFGGPGGMEYGNRNSEQDPK